MRLIILYRPNSEHERATQDFIREYQVRHQADHLEVINVDSREGIATATLYDVVQYPAILVLEADGYVQKTWQGPDLPLMEEVAAYANS